MPSVCKIRMSISCTQPAVHWRRPHQWYRCAQVSTSIPSQTHLSHQPPPLLISLSGHWYLIASKPSRISSSIATARTPRVQWWYSWAFSHAKRLLALLTSRDEPLVYCCINIAENPCLRKVGRPLVTQHIMDLEKHKCTEHRYQIVRRLTSLRGQRYLYVTTMGMSLITSGNHHGFSISPVSSASSQWKIIIIK